MAKKKMAPAKAPISFDQLDALGIGVGYRPSGQPAVDEPTVEAAVPERSTLRAMGDTAIHFGRGAVSGVRMMTDLAGADNQVSAGLRSADQAMGELLSATAKQDQQRIAEIMQEAEGKGWGDQIVAGLKAAGVAPGALLAQAAGSTLPTLAVAAIPGAGPAAAATRMVAAGAIGAGQGAGNIKGQIYETTKAELLKDGKTPEEAEARAVEAQSFGGPNSGQIALGGAGGFLAASTGAERAVHALRSGVTKTPAGMVGRMLQGGITEAVPEALQGGQEKFASNAALNNEGFRVDPWSGVLTQATMEGAAGFGMGAATGLPAPRVHADAIRAADKVPESGPLSRAANAGVEARAQAVEATGIDPTQPPEEPDQQPEPVDDPMVDRIKALPAKARTEALRAYAVLNRDGLAKGVVQYNRKLLDRLLAENDGADKAEPEPSGPLLLGYDQTPTGVMLAGPDGVRPEGRADVVNREQELGRQRDLGLTPDVLRAPRSEVADATPQEVGPPMGGDVAPAEVGGVEAATPQESAPQKMGAFSGADEAAAYISAQRRSGGSRFQALPLPMDDGSFGVATAESPEFGRAQEFRVKQERQAAGILDGDTLNKLGQPFKTRASAVLAAKKAGGEAVPVIGGFVVRKPTPQTEAPTNAIDQSPAPAVAAVESQAAAPVVDSVAAPVVGAEPEAVAALTKPQDSDVTNPEGSPTAEAEAAPDKASQAVPVSTAADADVPGAGPSTLETAGVAGKPIDDEWTAFAPKSGTKSVPRADMPQIKAEHRGAMVNFLNARGVSHESEVEIPAADLKPTQAEFSPARVAKARDFTGGDRSILVSKDGYVVDGHHQWLAKLEAGQPVKAIRLDAPIEKVLAEVRQFPSAETADGATPAARSAPAPASTTASTRAAKTPKEGPKPTSKTPTVDRTMAAMGAIRAGTGSIDDYKSSFADLESGEVAVKAELNAKTKEELLKAGGPYFYMRFKNDNKPDIIKAFYNDLLNEYALGKSYGSNAWVMSSGGFAAHEKRQHEALKALVEAQTDDDLKAFAVEVAARRAEVKTKNDAKRAAMENPQSLEDFRAVMREHITDGKTRKEAFLMLTPDQRLRYDELEAESTRQERETRKSAIKTEVKSAGQTTGGEIVATKHTRDGYDLFVVKLADRLSREDYTTVLASAKKLGGWYSAFRGGGAIPGFQFKDKANAEAFLKLAGGDTVDAQAQAEQRRDAYQDDRSETAAERLRTMADKLEEQAGEIEGADRKTNTARRARFASSALAGAAEMKAKATTMRNVAQAIDDGNAKFLDGVRTKSQVDMLTGLVATAKYNELVAKHATYAEQEKRRGEPPTAETADFAEFPAFTAYRSDLASLARQMLEVEGTKKLGQQLMNVADDVTDAYLDFAKAPGNLAKLSTFSIRRGDEVKAAIFPSKDTAERAIKRSGLTGKAIVLAERRGVNRIIMSPSEAINAKIWTGDGDKRITLTADAGNTLVAAVGRRGNKSNGLAAPWQFQTAHDRLKALSRIGIETPAEFRSALREFIGMQEQAVSNKVRELELAMVGKKNDGLDFFPTPAEVADQMVEAADLTPDMAVLEPSGGMGHIADRIRAAGAEPDVIEMAEDRRELLEQKGYNLTGRDFLDLKPREFFTYGDIFRAPDGQEGILRGLGGMGSDRVRLAREDGTVIGYYDYEQLEGVRHSGSGSGYDRIIMNPPFSNRRDAEHVQHAFTLLKPGGRIVAIMGEGVFFGSDKRAKDFRDWLDEVGGTSEKLPAGSFMDPSLPVNTGVSARMVVIDRPGTDGGSETALSIDDRAQSGDTASHEPASQTHRDAAARFVAALSKRIDGRSDDDLLDAVAPGDGERGRAAASVDAIARRLFAREVVYVKFRGQALFNGAVSKAAPGFIFINIDSKKPLMAVLGHELLHEIAKSQPGIYANLSRRLDALIKSEAKYSSRLADQYKRQGVSTKGLDAREELEADIVGDNFMDPEFWQALSKDQPGLFRRIANTIMKWLDGVAAKIGNVRPFGTDEFLSDIAAAREAVAGAIREFSGAEVGAMTDAAGRSVSSPPASDGDTRFSLAESFDRGLNNVRDLNLPAGYKVNDLFQAKGKLHWWHKTVGTQYNLAQRSPEFKPVFDTAQDFINDVAHYASAAADQAPTILPKLETLKDIAKSPLSAADNKAIAAPIFEGTLVWTRDADGKPVKADPGSEAPAGIVFTPDELRSLFKLSDEQVGLYQEFRAAADMSLSSMAVGDIMRYGGKDLAAIRGQVLAAETLDDAAQLVDQHLETLAEANPGRAEVLRDTAARIQEKVDKARDLMDRGYAPLTRYGQHSLDVVDANGERVYFGLFESRAEANKMARQMKDNFPEAAVSQGTMSQEEYKLFSGVSPETVELFGDMLGLESTGDGEADQAFQSYLKLAKANRSAMKRLIHRKGIAGFSEDPGRVLAGFVYSNARQTSSSLHMGKLTEAVAAVPKGQGELKDAAVKLRDYVQNPQEEAQAFRGLLFAQYLGGSIASAMVNTTQPFAVTFPWLTQYGGVVKAAGQMRRAVVDVLKKSTGDADLDAALKDAEESGIVSPQEVFQLQAQASGRAPLRAGDGSVAGNAMAAGSNALSKFSLAWGKLFGVAEQFNRRTTFIAAYRTAVEQGMDDPAEFAAKAIYETQFVYSKANKPRWARGAIGGTLFTFKQYSVNYMELLHRMATQGGPEGKRAALLALGVLVLLSGAGGLPFAEDADDLIDGALQRMGYNFSSKQAKQEFFANIFGQAGAQFVMRGVSGIAGVPIDVSGRFGMQNLIPGTGALLKKEDRTRDLMELAGPAGDFAKRIAESGEKLMAGEVLGPRGAVATVLPLAFRNVAKAHEMATTGMYLDTKGKKVIDADGFDAAAKAIGFQPNDVARVQDATFEVQRRIGLNKMRESEIAGKWAKGVFLGDQDLVQEARAEIKDWNETNPEAPIKIQMPQIVRRVREMRTSKQDRIAKTAPSEIRDQVKRELARELQQ